MGIVDIRNLTKVYRVGGRSVYALKNVSFSVEEGEFLGVIGPSGSGKTTLLNLIGGLARPTEGEVWVAGIRVSDADINTLIRLRRETIGFIFQLFNLIGFMSAIDNVVLPMLIAGHGYGEARRRAEALLREVGLGGKAYRPVNRLSVGEQQRVAIARAVANKPRLVLADEPTSNLDWHTGRQIIEFMRRFNEEDGVTFIIATHDPEVIKLVDRRITLRDGVLVEQGGR